MLDRMAYDLPREDDFREIAVAPLDEQEAVWKANYTATDVEQDWDGGKLPRGAKRVCGRPHEGGKSV